MGTYLGVDWASKGWVAAELDDEGELAVGFYPSIWNLWYEYDDEPERILVDIPIGLPDERRRACDAAAKAKLGTRASTVFWTPIREAAYEDHVCVAKERQRDATGDSISNQTWAIVPRIREVDAFLRETEPARDVVRESHPELCFHGLNGGEPVESKSGDGGIETRRNLLESETPLDSRDCDRAVGVLAEPDYARFAAENDVLDALVLAATAKRAADGRVRTLPDESPTEEEMLPVTDAEGLPMEIVYPDS